MIGTWYKNDLLPQTEFNAYDRMSCLGLSGDALPGSGLAVIRANHKDHTQTKLYRTMAHL